MEMGQDKVMASGRGWSMTVGGVLTVSGEYEWASAWARWFGEIRAIGER